MSIPKAQILGNWFRRSSGEYEIYTLRGWVTVDIYAELVSELNEIESLAEKRRCLNAD